MNEALPGVDPRCEGADRKEVLRSGWEEAHRSHVKALGTGTIHMVSAWGPESEGVSGQRAIDDESNGITASPWSPDDLQVPSCTMTADAIGARPLSPRKPSGKP